MSNTQETSFMERVILERQEQEQNEIKTKPESKLKKWKKKLMEIFSEFTRWTKYHSVIIIFIFAIVVPTLIFAFVYVDYKYDRNHTCMVQHGYQVPCGREKIKPKDCLNVDCCFNYSSFKCYHTVPSKYKYVSSDADWGNGFKPLLEKSPFGVENIKRIYLSRKIEKNKISITLSKNPIPKDRIVEIGDENNELKVTLFSEVMGIEVRRRSNDQLLLSTDHGPTIMSEGYWEWTLDLNSSNIYGLDQFRIKDDVTTTKVIYPNKKEHGIVPKFMAENNGSFHGIQIYHNGPIEISVLPSKLIVLRMLSGENLKIELVPGPTPVDVLKQQRIEPVVPPYWFLGVHICRNLKWFHK